MPLPGSLTTITVTGTYLKFDGTPESGVVEFVNQAFLQSASDNIIVAYGTTTVALDTNGSFTAVLPATNDPQWVPLGFTYNVYERLSTARRSYVISLPYDGGPVNLADVAPVEAIPPTGSFLPLIGGVITGNLGVNGVTTLTNATISGSASIGSNLTVGGNQTITGTLGVTGNSTMSGNLTVDDIITGTYQGITGDVMQLLASTLSTHVTHGGEFTPNVDPTKLDIGPLTGWIVDYDSTATELGPTNPSITYVSYPGIVGLTPSFSPITHFRVDSTGTLIQQLNRLTPTQRRQSLQLGFVVIEGGNIIVDQTIPVIPSQLNNQLCDLMNALGPFIDSGCVLSANGVNLTFNRTSGTIFSRAFSQVPTYLDPHNSTLTAQTPTNFRHMTALFPFASALTTILDVANYDPNGAGTVTAIGGGANTATNFRVWAIANNTANEQILVQYGQSTFASLSAAQAAIGSGTYIPTPLSTGGALVGWISVIKSATNLSDPTQAIFTARTASFPTP